MFKKSVCFVSILSLLALTGVAGAAAYTWDDEASPDHSWMTPVNWDPNDVPGLDPTDSIQITAVTVDPCWPVLDNDYNMPLFLNGPPDDPGSAISGAAATLAEEPKLTIVDGNLTTDGLFILGGWFESHGCLSVQGGVFKPPRLWVGYQEDGRLSVTGGSVILTPTADQTLNILEIARGDNCETFVGGPEPSGYVHLDGGVIDCGLMNMKVVLMAQTSCAAGDFVARESTGNGYMDITGGKLIVGGGVGGTYGDQRYQIHQYADEPNGWITAYGVGDMNDGSIVSHPRARLVLDYDFRNPGRTTLTAYKASQFEAYNLAPEPYATDVMPNVTLSWTAGDYVKLGGLFKGTANAKYGNGHHVCFSTDPTLVNKDIKGILRSGIGTATGNLGTQDPTSRNIGADFGGILALDKIYYWCVIETNDTNAPTGNPDLSGWGGWIEPNLSKWAWKSMVQAFRTLSPAPTLVAPAPSGTTVSIGVGAPLTVALQWNRGYYGADVMGHDVYLGTTFNDVNNASVGNDPNLVYKGRQTETTYSASVLLGKTYYWRIDEVNTAGPDPCLWKGNVWNFVVGNWRSVDEFADANETIFRSHWKRLGSSTQPDPNDYVDGDCTLNGSGALISLAGGAMQFDYDNNDRFNCGDGTGACLYDYFSDARRLFTSPQDWTYGDPGTTLRAIAIAFRGNVNNQTDPNYDLNRMYCIVEDSGGNSAMVLNNLSEAQKATSDEWNIDLADFNEAGVNEKRISAIYLGFGIRCNSQDFGLVGGEGRVFFDSIRAVPARCVGEPNFRMLGDISGAAAMATPSNCVVDLADVKTLVNAWLAKDRLAENPVAVPGNDPCMLVRYEFNGNWNNDANGRVGTLANGVEVNNPELVNDAQRGNVAHFPQADTCDIVLLGTWGQDGNFAGKSFTIAFWAKHEAATPEESGWAEMVGKGESYQKVEFLLGSPPQSVHAVAHSSGVIVSVTKLQLGTWYHVAETYTQFADMNGGMQREYINGRLEGENDINEIPYDQPRHAVEWCDPNWTLGCMQEEGNTVSSPPTPVHLTRPFQGFLDDVRVYDRALSEAELTWLHGGTTANYYGIASPSDQADIYSPEPKGSKIVNAKDLAVLAQDWLKSQLWP